MPRTGTPSSRIDAAPAHPGAMAGKEEKEQEEEQEEEEEEEEEEGHTIG
jgi:hypothetical protein